MEVTQILGTEKGFSAGGSSYLVHIPRYYKAKLPVSENNEVSKQDPRFSVSAPF